MLVMVPIALGGSMILWLSIKEFSYTEPKMSPPEIWSPTLNWAGLKSHEIPRSSAWVLIPPTDELDPALKGGETYGECRLTEMLPE